ncbi:hypothetical protein RDG65_003100 [Vibrio fluvialis]|nr:hypothetical protein [Vibrio fluvialis]ELE5027792.1 hypothetical protein [Vibrio fluvialis]
MQTLNDPNASLEQKQQAQQVLVNNIAAQMKVDPAVVLQAMTTDEQNSPTKGGYINGGDTLYVNGGLHDTLQDEANTVGHEKCSITWMIKLAPQRAMTALNKI